MEFNNAIEDNDNKMNDIFVILWHNAPLISIEIPRNQYPIPDDILRQYAEKYGFDRKDIRGCFIRQLDWKEFSAP